MQKSQISDVFCRHPVGEGACLPLQVAGGSLPADADRLPKFDGATERDDPFDDGHWSVLGTDEVLCERNSGAGFELCPGLVCLTHSGIGKIF